MTILVLVFQFIILIFAIMIHEVSHGAMANLLGDSTAKDEGRLTLNPAKHFDFFGSFLLPLMLFFASSGRLLFGWAKPVPFNPYNLKNPKRDAGLIGLAGPLSNILLAIIFGIAIRLIDYFQIVSIFRIAPFFALIVQINLFLAVFNLVPIPPLDGSKILFALLPRNAGRVMLTLEQYGIYILVIFMFFGFQFIYPIIDFLYKLILGG